MALTAAATAVVLGGGLLTVQRDSGTDRHLAGTSPGAPDHRPGTPSASPSRNGPESAEPSPGPSEGAGRPGHGGGAPEERADRGAPRHPGPRDHHGEDSPEEDGRARQAVALPRSTLRVGDAGPEVAQLQRRLKQVDFLAGDAPEDGVFSTVVQESVFRFQVAHGVRGDTDGEFGPRTREALRAPGAA